MSSEAKFNDFLRDEIHKNEIELEAAIKGSINAAKEISTFVLLIVWAIWGREWFSFSLPVLYFLNLWAWNVGRMVALKGVK